MLSSGAWPSSTSSSTTATRRTWSMTSSMLRSSAWQSVKATWQFAKRLNSLIMGPRNAFNFPRLIADTLSPMMCTDAYFVRLSRPSPNVNRSTPNMTWSWCRMAHSLISSTEPLPPPSNGNCFTSGLKSAQFQMPPVDTSFKPSMPLSHNILIPPRPLATDKHLLTRLLKRLLRRASSLACLAASRSSLRFRAASSWRSFASSRSRINCS
mmetsp:Transcript_93482/g.270054  ORF Transcript_93482/g.270054 Transcript_93482/m.270054 type:complete len:210 (+) Transcript_93482:377-1006(+)